METPQNMKLRILLPHEIFLDADEISSVQVSTDYGSFGFLPQRLDCVSPLSVGLVTYIDGQNKENFVAIDQGIVTKAGRNVTFAVRNAIAGTDLGELHVKIDEQFRNVDEDEQKVRRVMAQLETGFIRNFEQLSRT